MAAFGVAGAGFSGAVVARELAEAGHRVVVFDRRPHVAGNCHTERDPHTGVMVHRYGPHIFHTADSRVWAYVNRFAQMVPYRHTVRTTVGGRVYPLPVNLTTINLLFGTDLDPAGAREFVAARAEPTRGDPRTFEEQALATVGREIYATFLEGYTAKQWGIEPRHLPASVLKRLPVRFTDDDSYFDHPHQAIPRDGYTALVAAILDHPSIEVRVATSYDRDTARGFDHTVWTGPLDAWFGHAYGRLAYRTLDFDEFRADGDYQGCAVMNYGDREVPYTRITEFKHFAAWEHHATTVCYREYSRQAGPDDDPYYPVRLAGTDPVLDRYVAAARAEQGVSFVGRLGTYRYLDMDAAIGEALAAAGAIIAATAAGTPIPSLFVDP